MAWSLAGRRGRTIGVAVGLSGAIGLGVVSCGESFEPGGGTTTATGAPTGGVGGSSTGTASGTPTGAGGATSTSTGVGGGGGSSMTCVHDPCVAGEKLDAGCHPCVADICAQSSWCCNAEWDYRCVAETWRTCGRRCDGGTAVSCDQQYGGAPNYTPCPSGEGECRFAIYSQNMSCAQACAFNGGVCIAAELDECRPAPLNTECDTVGVLTTTCICSRGCGAGDPCTGNQTCDGFACF